MNFLQVLRKLFKKHDKDASGYINPKHTIDIFVKAGQNLSKKQEKAFVDDLEDLGTVLSFKAQQHRDPVFILISFYSLKGP